MKMKKLMLLGAIFGSGLLAYNCGGGGGGDTASSGTVSFYLTDALVNGSPQNPQKVEITVKNVSLVNSSTGVSCQLFSDPQGYTVDLTDLANSMRLVDVSSCPTGTYDKFVVQVSQSTSIMLNNTIYTCNIDPSLTPENDTNITCSNSECTIEIRVEDGGLNIVEGQNQVSLDFEVNDGDGDEREMIVNIDNSQSPPSCNVAFEIEEIEPEEMENHMESTGKNMELEGRVSSIDENNMTFELTSMNGSVYTVDYSNTQGQNIGNVLNLAYSNSLKVEVECQNLDLNNATCTAEEIELEVKGTVNNVSGNTLTLDLGNNNTITVQGGEWEGNIQDGSFVEVKIVGFDGNNYIAEEVEQEM